ncbi:uncharacterized protein Z518_03186 [Rhinocladiella mackenziei CBS 650.93]|uniref:Helicase C-terminal domain-containing protein n=1 Tax=Rhinocladiella mackenziei CBS 650.93 TaxID=1442369 RepID=A0A0D2JGU8_9EURO|nr:uncharacterized protein Z518_03186 [Rhinocladiella mackenziei CBS 650.93]KIX08530.1 hypothetical protein Z518_03186 [Rhinocladiella mackenziei CBS 650.93]
MMINTAIPTTHSRTSGEVVTDLIGPRANHSTDLEDGRDPDPDTVSSISAMMICFGMLCDIVVEIVVSIESLPGEQELSWDGGVYLQHPTERYYIGKLSSTMVRILQALASEATPEFQFLLSSRQLPARSQNARPNTSSSIRAVATDRSLSIIVYGPREMATSVEDWLGSIKMYLQVPRGCNRDVPYRNPQCLASNQDFTIYTSQLSSDFSQHQTENQDRYTDPFLDLYNDSVLEEACQPYTVASKLHSHQRQALTFLIQREKGWDYTGTKSDFWKSHIDSFVFFRFLGVYPYNEWKTFDEQILRPWKTKMDESALKRLQSIMKAITIRRPRSVITLPDRREHTEMIHFTTEERTIYEKARSGVIEVLNNAMSIDQSGSVYLNAFQRINDLRYMCNHGISPRRHKDNAGAVNMLGPAITDVLDGGLAAWDTGTEVLCVNCGADLVEEEANDQNLMASGYVPSSLPSSVCRNCLQHGRQQAPLTPSPSCLSSGYSTPRSPTILQQPSSKIKALLAQIHQLPSHDKCVVFSYWTSSLDAVQEVLVRSGIGFTRYDGKLGRSKRSQLLKDFAEDTSLRVFLVSISCGGQGLDLTSANHAFLLEPQWNPMLEEQAMARVHRLGQKKAVHLVRFVVENTCLR